MIVLLDSNVLGKLTHPRDDGEERACKDWAEKLFVRGAKIVTSEICDYEVRRGLILASMNKKNVEGIELLDQIETQQNIELLALGRNVIREAAQIWAESQKLGIPMTKPEKLDADSIICAHWRILTQENPQRLVIVATTNLKHLNRFAEALNWRAITL